MFWGVSDGSGGSLRSPTSDQWSQLTSRRFLHKVPVHSLHFVVVILNFYFPRLDFSLVANLLATVRLTIISWRFWYRLESDPICPDLCPKSQTLVQVFHNPIGRWVTPSCRELLLRPSAPCSLFQCLLCFRTVDSFGSLFWFTGSV